MITGNIILSVYFIGGVAVGYLTKASATWTRLGIWMAGVTAFLVIGMEVIK